MHRCLRQGQQFHGLVDDLAELAPVGKVAFVHPFLDGGQDPADTGNIVRRPVGIGAPEAGDDARPGIAIVLFWNTRDQVLRLAVARAMRRRSSEPLCRIMPQVQASVFDSCSVSLSMSDRIPLEQSERLDEGGRDFELPRHAAPHRVFPHFLDKETALYKEAHGLSDGASVDAGDFD